MIEYIKSFKTYIPTWIICIFMFVGVFGWTFIIGLTLLIIQCIQRKKLKNDYLQLKMDNLNIRKDALADAMKVDSEIIQENEAEINRLKNLISDKDNLIFTLNKKIFEKSDDETKNIDNYNNLVYENNALKNQIEQLNNSLSEKQSYDFEERRIIEDEFRILNNNLIEKYYHFSDYSSLTSEDCKNELILLKQKEKELRNSNNDIVILNHSKSQKVLTQYIRQILRNFNMECDNILLKVKTSNIDTCRRKVQQSYETLNKLYYIDDIQLSKEYLKLKLEQISLIYTYELKYQQEKEIQKTIKEQMVEDARAQKEFEERRKQIEKDLQQHTGERNRLIKYMQKTQSDIEKENYLQKIKELEEKIKSLQTDRENVREREINAKAGFVYIISNIGSFGENIYKIGMTRRLEPMDRIRELSSASVPFEFDVHAMIFSSDAPDLENTLHKHFADKAVNKVNPRKEFFKVTIDEIEKIVKENYNETVQFTKIPVAAEYYQSINSTEKNELIFNQQTEKIDLYESLKENNNISTENKFNEIYFNKSVLNERNDYDMYDKEKGIYPSGQYLVGRDLPLGAYLFTPRENECAEIVLYPSYTDFKNDENEIFLEDLESDYHMCLHEPNTFLVVRGADIQKL